MLVMKLSRVEQVLESAGVLNLQKPPAGHAQAREVFYLGMLIDCLTRPFQDLLFFRGAVDINRAIFTAASTQGSPYLPDLKARLIRVFMGGASLFHLTIKNIPARSQLKQTANARQSKALVMDQPGDLLYLFYLKI
jgi:hypothetical protein